MAQRAGGLYGGIRFSTNSALPTEQAPNLAPVPAPVSTPVIEAPPTVAIAPQETNEQASDAASKSSAGWSAALAFAPVRRPNKPKPVTAARLPQAAVMASLAAAASTPAAPLVPTPSAEVSNEPEVTGGWGKKIKAPSMVIDQDVNGFRAQHKVGEGKRRKKKKNINENLLIWDPFEQYDPFHPNDYHEYKNWKQREREERRMQERRRVEELKRRRDSSRSEYSSDSQSDDGRPNRKNARYHSPDREEDAPRGLGMPSFQSGGNLKSETDPNQMETARTQPVIPPAETGEEAYLRRLQMSQRPPRAPSPVAPKFVQSQSPATETPAPMPSFLSSEPVHDEDDDMDVSRRASPEVSPPPPAPPVSFTPLTQDAIEERKRAAAAIAARLAALSKPPPAPPEATQSEAGGSAPAKRNPATFAARLMAKQGYVPGQGLGANADGIVEPIMLEKAALPKAGKKGDAGGEGRPKKPGAGGMGIGGSNMGRIVNAQAEEKTKADLDKFGESSRIVVLTNMVALEDVDEDLQGEIGEECSKHGTVERVLVHLPFPTPPNPEDAVRIFVQFAGPAAAWKAVRDLDGRFFGGRKVRARYFEEGNFVRRLLDIPLL